MLTNILQIKNKYLFSSSDISKTNNLPSEMQVHLISNHDAILKGDYKVY